ncbi:MAG: DinB family protein [Gemmatimonadota bacterium]|nr:DinB family protein [Gemmatimonadota bacterium]
MKARRQAAALEPLILKPLRGLSKDDWHRAPDGRWTIAQIVSHVAQGVDLVAAKLEERAARTDMARRATPRQHLMRHLVLGVGRIPAGRKTPAATRPPERPDPTLVTAQYRMAVERLAGFVEKWPADQQGRVYVQHPVLGDLNLPEWVRFFYVHGRHHAHQIAVRLRWLHRQERRKPRRRGRKP